MKKLLLLIMSALLLCSAKKSEPLKIACLGDGITYGAGIEDREQDSYPAQLQKMLGNDYQVKNFGANGATALAKTDLSYVNQQQYKDLIDFQPNIVFLSLGTNDSKIEYRDIISNFEGDYTSLIKSLEQKIPGVKVVIMSPIKAHNRNFPNKGIDRRYLTQTIVKKVEQVAFNLNYDILDMHHTFNFADTGLLPDLVHPSVGGASLIALRVHEYIKTSHLGDSEYCFDSTLENPKNFYGYKCYDFRFNGVNSKVVVPRKTAQGRPWLQRARFWDIGVVAEDLALLERGFHIVYHNVANLFGSDKAVKRWDDFYHYLREKGLGEKCAIQGLSRGGLIAYNYAAKYPERVTAVLADAPVLDIKSWPLGHENTKEKTITSLLSAYDFKDIQEANEFKGNPLDNAKLLAKTDIKMIHVYGDTDTTVPPKDNTLAFAKIVEENGGYIKLFPKKGVGHVHGYYHDYTVGIVYPEPVTAELLRAFDMNYCPDAVVPIKGYRKRFKQRNTWQEVADEITDSISVNKYDILLLGNSITHGFSSLRKLSQSDAGLIPMNEAFPSHRWFTAGISADRTSSQLERILFDDYQRCNPKYVVITIGINNFARDRSNVKETVAGILACVEAARDKMPKAKILVFGTLPAQKHMEKCKQVAKILSKHKFGRGITYVDSFPTFAPDGENVIEEYYKKDKLHLEEKGYRAWTKLMQEYIK